MKFVYLTSKTYPATTADHFFMRNMAEAFTKILRSDFTLIVRGNISVELSDINTKYVKAPNHLRIIFYFFWFPPFILKQRYGKDVVIFSNDPYLLTISIFWKKLLGFKFKICSDWHQLFRDWRDEYVSLNSDYLVSTSENLKNLISNKFNIDKNKILVAYGGVDLEKFDYCDKPINEIRSLLRLPQDIFLVGYVGFYKTMGMSKGLDTMIKALKFINGEKVKMVFVGGKPGEILEYRLLAKKEGVEGRCIFVGIVDSDLVIKYEKALDILIIPYPNQPHFRDFGFPMKVYEYMASGKPIIYSNLPIMNEVLSDCATSFVADDACDLAEKIQIVIKNKNDVSFEAKNKVRQYTWAKRAENIIKFISK